MYSILSKLSNILFVFLLSSERMTGIGIWEFSDANKLVGVNLNTLWDKLTRSTDPKSSQPMKDDRYSMELTCTNENMLTLDPTRADIKAADGANVVNVPIESAINLVV